MSLAYFPLYPTDFDADTGHLTLAEDGAYNRLLRLSWKCPEAKMPDDLDWICRRARAVTAEDRAVIEAILAEFFTRKGGKIFSAKLHKIWKQTNEAHQKRVEAGKNGGRAKALKNKEITPSNASELPEQSPSNQNQNQNHIDTVANATDAEGVEPQDLSKDLFDRGVAFLTRHGIKETQARSVIGKWRRDHSDPDILSAFMACAKSGAVDPIPWITARLIPPQTFKPDFSKYGVPQ